MDEAHVSDQTIALPDAAPQARARLGQSALRPLSGAATSSVVAVLGQLVSVGLDELLEPSASKLAIIGHLLRTGTMLLGMSTGF